MCNCATRTPLAARYPQKWDSSTAVGSPRVLLLISAPGCSDGPRDGVESDALTVHGGKTYVVSVDEHSVTLRKTSNGRSLETYLQLRTAQDMIGRAILVHPIKGTTDEGHYGRVL